MLPGCIAAPQKRARQFHPTLRSPLFLAVRYMWRKDENWHFSWGFGDMFVFMFEGLAVVMVVVVTLVEHVLVIVCDVGMIKIADCLHLWSTHLCNIFVEL